MEKKQDFLNLVNNVDKCFLTSSPELFKKNKIYNKLRFIPNPIDSSIDHLRNYEINDLEYDLFLRLVMDKIELY